MKENSVKTHLPCVPRESPLKFFVKPIFVCVNEELKPSGLKAPLLEHSPMTVFLLQSQLRLLHIVNLSQRRQQSSALDPVHVHTRAEPHAGVVPRVSDTRCSSICLVSGRNVAKGWIGSDKITRNLMDTGNRSIYNVIHRVSHPLNSSTDILAFRLCCPVLEVLKGSFDAIHLRVTSYFQK